MKNCFKKMVSFVLAGSLLMSVSATSLAADADDGNGHPDVLTLQSDGHGQFSIADGRSRSADTITVTATEDEEIYHIDGDQYVTLADEDRGVYIQATKLDVDIDDIAANDAMFEEYNVSQEIIDDIQRVVAYQKEIGNDDLTVSVFSPYIKSNTMTRADEPLGENYYTYNGYKMQDISVKWDKLYARVEVHGPAVLSAMKSCTDLLFSVLGHVKKIELFSYYGIGSSAYSAFESITGITGVKSSYGDYGMASAMYAEVRKYTSVNSGGTWALGCISMKYWIYDHYTVQEYSGHDRNIITKAINTAQYTENFKSPARQAVVSHVMGSHMDNLGTVELMNKYTVFLDGTNKGEDEKEN